MFLQQTISSRSLKSCQLYRKVNMNWMLVQYSPEILTWSTRWILDIESQHPVLLCFCLLSQINSVTNTLFGKIKLFSILGQQCGINTRSMTEHKVFHQSTTLSVCLPVLSLVSQHLDLAIDMI